MSFEWDELIERLVTDNNDVNEILEALDKDWNVAERLHKINEDSMEEVVFDNMTMGDVINHMIDENSVEDILNYIEASYSKKFHQFIEEGKFE